MVYTKKFKFNHGDSVREKVSGFEGVITGTAFYISGGNQYLVVAKSVDNVEPISLWFDEGRLKLKQRNLITIENDSNSKTGFSDIKTYEDGGSMEFKYNDKQYYINFEIHGDTRCKIFNGRLNDGGDIVPNQIEFLKELLIELKDIVDLETEHKDNLFYSLTDLQNLISRSIEEQEKLQNL